MTERSTNPRSQKKMGALLPVCLICEQTPPDGIAGGILVSGRFLCVACEEEIVHTRVGDRRYSHLKDKVKRIWAQLKA